MDGFALRRIVAVQTGLCPTCELGSGRAGRLAWLAKFSSWHEVCTTATSKPSNVRVAGIERLKCLVTRPVHYYLHAAAQEYVVVDNKHKFSSTLEDTERGKTDGFR